MSCKCKNIIQNFEGGDIPLTTSFLSPVYFSANTYNSGSIFSGGTNLLDIFCTPPCGGGASSGDCQNIFWVDNIYGCSGTTTIHSDVTINGSLSAQTLSAFTGIWASDFYGYSPITVHDDFVLLSGLTAQTLTIGSLVSGTPIFSLGLDSSGNVVSGTTGAPPFTGNTSASCINELWVSNISGCSPVTIGTPAVFNQSVDVYGDLTAVAGTGNIFSNQYYVEGSLGLDWDSGNSAIALGNGGDSTRILGTDLTIIPTTTFNSSATVNGDVLVVGNVNILGTATTINTQTLTIDDNIITLNANATGNTVPFPIDSGLEILRGSGTTACILWEETNGYWAAGLSASTRQILLDGDVNTLYDSDGTVTSARTVKLDGNTLTFTGGTVTIRGQGNTSGTINLLLENSSSDPLFSMLDDGAFTLGKDAITNNSTSVAIGTSAEAKAINSIALGNNTLVDTDAGGGQDGIAIGNNTQGRTSGIAIGATAYCYATNISIGNYAGDYNTSKSGIVTIGNKLRPTGANSINLAGRNSSGGNIVPDEDDTFGVYLSTTAIANSPELKFRVDNDSWWNSTGSFGFGTITPDASALIDMVSTTKGFLPPVMTTVERDAINSGTFADGLVVYDSTLNELQFYNGTTWVAAGGGSGGFTGNTSATCINELWVSTISGCSPVTIGPDVNVDGPLTITASGNTQPVFNVLGSSGQLFSINDSLVGELFSVNDISGIPILSVNSDDTVLMGNFDAPALNSSVKSTVNIGSTTIYSVPTSAYTSAYFDYNIVGNGSARAGNVMAIWSGSTVNYSETSTTDIGNTSPVTLSVGLSGGMASFTASATTNNWVMKTIVRSI